MTFNDAALTSLELALFEVKHVLCETEKKTPVNFILVSTVYSCEFPAKIRQQQTYYRNLYLTGSENTIPLSGIH